MNQTQTEPVAPLMNEPDHTADGHVLLLPGESTVPMLNGPYPERYPIADIDNWFTHHPPTPEQVAIYQRIRDEGKRFALLLIALIPPSADRTVAIRKIREAVMTANAAIACGGR